jgi:polygalacturonase
MKRKHILIFLATFSLGIGQAQDSGFLTQFPWAQKVGAKSYPIESKEFYVNNYGAKGDGITMNTQAIQATIDACAASGGGVVSFKPGQYVTGSIFLKSGVRLHIGKEVTLLGSQKLEDYPDIDTRAAGIELKWPAALINVIDQQNVAITGDGLINARGKVFWDKYHEMRKEYNPKGLRWIVDYDCKRARTILIQNSKDVTLKGLTIHQAGFWTVQVVYSQYVTVAGLTIRNNIDGKGPSTDAIDIDSSSYVLVEGCDTDCNDDNYCLKAGRDADGLRVNRPCEYVVLRNCVSRSGGGTLICGSETAGCIRHILAYNMKAIRSSSGVRLKSAITRGGTLEDINVYNFELDSVNNAVAITMNWNPAYSYSTLPSGYDPETIPTHWKVMLQKVTPEQGLPHFKDIHITGMKGSTRRTAFDVAGMPESKASGFTITDFHVSSKTAGKITYAKDWTLKNVTIIPSDSSKLVFENCEGMQYK